MVCTGCCVAHGSVIMTVEGNLIFWNNFRSIPPLVLIVGRDEVVESTAKLAGLFSSSSHPIDETSLVLQAMARTNATFCRKTLNNAQTV
jgi:hypothetical protein